MTTRPNASAPGKSGSTIAACRFSCAPAMVTVGARFTTTNVAARAPSTMLPSTPAPTRTRSIVPDFRISVTNDLPRA